MFLAAKKIVNGTHEKHFSKQIRCIGCAVDITSGFAIRQTNHGNHTF